jgi:alcohol dehydrogenase class IV
MTSKYYMPTRVFTGIDCISNNKEVFKTLGKTALIVTGARSAKENGSEKDVRMALESVGISYLLFDRVKSNPTVACVKEGAETARLNGVDFIIAIGGGSPMDAGKAIALLAAQEIDEAELFSGNYKNGVLPVACVPTTAGTGSEVTQYAILTNDKAQTKTSIATDYLFPAVAFLDSKYMRDLPVGTTVNTAIDALSHAVEGMLSVRASLVSNTLATESIRLIMESIPELLKAAAAGTRAISLQTREMLLQASMMAGMVIAQTGTTAVHAMGYSLTYFKDIDHGRANGLLLAEYLRLVEKQQPELSGRILKSLGLAGVNEFRELMDRLLGTKEAISAEEIRQYSALAMKTKNISNSIVKPDEEDLTRIFEASFAG